jgi:hypothetical protein
MATGLSNKLTGQIGEYMVCAELGRLGLIATSFTGNVPEFDLLVCDSGLKSLPIQVKTTRSTTWPSRADLWLNIEIDDTAKCQINQGRKVITNPELIYVCVALGATRAEDRFFICTKTDIQDACIQSYTDWMDPKDWKRPKNYKSLDNRYGVEHLAVFEDNWQLIQERLKQL